VASRIYVGNTALNYFTLNWWHGQEDDYAVDAFSAYREHSKRIEDKLPSRFAEFCKSISLHDSRLQLLRVEVANRNVRMELTGDDGRGGLRRFVLTYLEIAALESNADPNNGLPACLDRMGSAIGATMKPMHTTTGFASIAFCFPAASNCEFGSATLQSSGAITRRYLP
jgi:hypothetical protein